MDTNYGYELIFKEILCSNKKIGKFESTDNIFPMKNGKSHKQLKFTEGENPFFSLISSKKIYSPVS